jgi:hypothetical protein
MKNTISKYDFNFNQVGYGQWDVIYTSPNTHKKWMAYTTDSILIDATKNSDLPKIKDLNQLKKICKS